MRPTAPFEKLGPVDRFVSLEAGRTALDCADAARGAALAFCETAHLGWGAEHLSAWVNGAYRIALSAAHPDPVVQLSELPDFSDESVAREVARARSHAIALVANAAADWRGRGFPREMIDAGFVVGVTDEHGGLGYAPVNRSVTRLGDRIVSLFLADFLTRPRDYESLAVCRGCGEISFEWDEVHAQDCDAVGLRSGVVVRRPNFTRIGLGDRRRG